MSYLHKSFIYAAIMSASMLLFYMSSKKMVLDVNEKKVNYLRYWIGSLAFSFVPFLRFLILIAMWVSHIEDTQKSSARSYLIRIKEKDMFLLKLIKYLKSKDWKESEDGAVLYNKTKTFIVPKPDSNDYSKKISEIIAHIAVYSATSSEALINEIESLNIN